MMEATFSIPLTASVESWGRITEKFRRLKWLCCWWIGYFECERRRCPGRFSGFWLWQLGGWWFCSSERYWRRADLERRRLGGEASRKKENFRSKYLSLMCQQDLFAWNDRDPIVSWMCRTRAQKRTLGS